MACGIAWFSLASLLLPVALSAPVRRSTPTSDVRAPKVCCCFRLALQGVSFAHRWRAQA